MILPSDIRFGHIMQMCAIFFLSSCGLCAAGYKVCAAGDDGDNCIFILIKYARINKVIKTGGPLAFKLCCFRHTPSCRRVQNARLQFAMLLREAEHPPRGAYFTFVHVYMYVDDR